jgi:hypothetical protein
MKKVCTKCGIVKRDVDFVVDSNALSGRGSRCKDCKNELTRYARKEKGRAYQGNEVLRTRKYREVNREKEAARRARYRNLNGSPPREYTSKRAAGAHLRLMVQEGKIIKPKACSECGTSCNPHGHHPDYSKPYEVEWLCSVCHGKRHRKEVA